MNAYVSRDEKENLVRLMVLQPVLTNVIDVYGGIKSTDRKFLTELKHCKTRLEKAIDLRT